MYQALYRKYRPKSFDDVVGQAHITRTLQNEVIDRKNSTCLSVYRLSGNRKNYLLQDFGKGGQLPASHRTEIPAGSVKSAGE